jgi:hypothetical protein
MQTDPKGFPVLCARRFVVVEFCFDFDKVLQLNGQRVLQLSDLPLQRAEQRALTHRLVRRHTQLRGRQFAVQSNALLTQFLVLTIARIELLFPEQPSARRIGRVSEHQSRQYTQPKKAEHSLVSERATAKQRSRVYAGVPLGHFLLQCGECRRIDAHTTSAAAAVAGSAAATATATTAAPRRR